MDPARTKFRSSDPESQRRLLRRRVRIPASIVSSTLRARQVMIWDLTALGCRIEVRCRLAPGTFVMLRLPALRPIGGTIIWEKDGHCGFSFAEPLHRILAEHVLALSEPMPATQAGEPATLAEWDSWSA